MNPPHTDGLDPKELPEARVEKSRITWLFWLVPLAAAAFVAWLVYSHTLGAGPTIHIYFSDAEDLEAGKSQVKYRGAVVGEVKAIHLAGDLRSVDVEVQLTSGADKIAREGSEFWIVKPEVSAAEVTGLRTIVSGSFIGVKPGDGGPQSRFRGVDEPSLVERKRAGTQFVLIAAELGGMKKGAPVLYRGIKVGEVTDYQLGPKSQTVDITIDINKEYAPLVRTDSKFWNAGGVNVDLGLHGLDISAESFKTLVGGGIAFATPDQPGKQAPAGTAFRLYDKPEQSWTRWMPDIRLGFQSPVVAVTSHEKSNNETAAPNH